MSTTWVMEEYRRAGEVYQEHLRIIEAFDPALKARDDRVRVLERENAELKAKLQAYTNGNLSRIRKKMCRIARKPPHPRREKGSGGLRWDIRVSGMKEIKPFFLLDPLPALFYTPAIKNLFEEP